MKVARWALAFVLGAAFAMSSLAQSASGVADLAPPAHPCTEAQVREYLKLTGSDARAKKFMQLMIDGSRATADASIPPAMWDDMSKAFAAFDLVSIVTPAYQKYLSQEDLESVLNFYRTPAGQRLLASQPLVESYSGEAGKKEGQKIAAEIVAKYQDQIVARRKQLDAEAAARAGKAAEPTIQLTPEKK